MAVDASTDKRTVFVVHGRNASARDGIYSFLRAVGLRPLEWSQAVNLTGKGSPYIGEVLEHAFEAAQAVVVLFTPDEITYLRSEYGDADDPDTQPATQARPNVLFEAGMALGRNPDRTIFVEVGKLRPFSDVAGRHALRVRDDVASRKELAERLLRAGCDVDLSGSDWLSAGDFSAPPLPGGGLPLGKRLAESAPLRQRVTARYSRGSRSGRLDITNHGPNDILELSVELPPEAGSGFHLHQNGTIARLPVGETASFVASRSMGPGSDHFEIAVHGRSPDGEELVATAFVNLVG